MELIKIEYQIVLLRIISYNYKIRIKKKKLNKY